jgi:hypothetical protein
MMPDMDAKSKAMAKGQRWSEALANAGISREIAKDFGRYVADVEERLTALEKRVKELEDTTAKGITV